METLKIKISGNSSEFREDIQKNIKILEKNKKKLGELEEKIKDTNDSLNSRTVEDFSKTLEKALTQTDKKIDATYRKLLTAEEKFNKHSEKTQDMVKKGASDEELDKEYSKMAKEEETVLKLKEKLNGLEAKHLEITENVTKQYNTQTESLKQKAIEFDNSKNKIKEENKEIEKSIKLDKLKSGIEKVKETVSSISKTLSKPIQGLFSRKSLNSVNTGFNKVKGTIGKMTMALFGARTAYTLISKAVRQIMDENQQLANTVSTVWNGIIGAIAPAVNAIISFLATALNYVLAMVSVIGKFDAFGSLKKKQKSKKGGTGGGDSSGKLYSFDTSETLQKSGGGGSGDATTDNYIKQVELSETLLNYAKKLREIWEGVQKVASNLVDRIKEGLDYMDSGTRILQVGKDLLNAMLDDMLEIVNATVEWSESINFGPVFNGIANALESIEPILEKIGDLAVFIYTQAILPIATWITESFLPAFLEAVSSQLDVVNVILEQMQEPLQWIWDNVISPLASAVGETIISILEQISELADEFGTWLSDHPEFVEFVTLAAGLVATLAALVIGFNLVISVVGLFASALTSPIVVIGLIFAGIVALIAKFGDMNSATENMRTVFQGLLDFVKGVFTGDWELAWEGIKEIFGGIWGLICNICDAFLNAITEQFKAFGIDISGVMDGIRAIMRGIIDFVAGIFTGNWKRAWEGVKDIFKTIWNGIVSLLERAVNFIVDGLNKINFSIPDWVPFAGGKSFGFNLGRVSLPKLAKGAVIPPNKEFLAILGDQTRGKNIETPEGLLREIVQQESGAQEVNIIASGDVAQIIKFFRFKIQDEDKRIGESLIVGG